MQRFILLFVLIVFGSNAWSKRLTFPYAGRIFTLVTPENPQKNAPLLVLLHGCKQSSKIILDGTELDKVAEKKGFFILAPEQPSIYNVDNCWNWFLDYQQRRLHTNEMGQIMAGVDLIFKQYSINQNRVYVAGMSAGGVMAHTLTTCYPDYFAGSAIHSGLNYRAAEDFFEAQTVLTSYQQKSPDYLGKKMYECSRKTKDHKLSKVLIIHGQDDSRVMAFHSALIKDSQAVWRDYLDDGQYNDSVMGQSQLKITRFGTRYEIEQTDTTYPGFTERLVLIKGLGHAWGGGKPVSVNFDPKAPSSNKFILDFFSL